MKILLLTHKFSPDVGGIEVNSEILSSEFTRYGHEVRVLTWSQSEDGVCRDYLVIRNPNLLRIIREHRWADVVYENNPCLRLAWPAVFFGKPSVIALRTWLHRGNSKVGFQDWVKSKWLERADAVIAVSEAIRARTWPLAQVIGNPYRVQEFYQLPDWERNRDFVFLGRIVSDKGAYHAVEALHRIVKGEKSERQSPFNLTIIGDGNELNDLITRVDQLGLKNQVIFKGQLRGIPLLEALNSHRFLLVPSLWEEPFGNVALEGMASGCIPIVSDGGGLPDAVGDAGLIFERGSIAGLVEAMSRLANDSELERSLRAKAPGHLSRHLPEIVARRYLDVIESAVAKKTA